MFTYQFINSQSSNRPYLRDVELIVDRFDLLKEEKVAYLCPECLTKTDCAQLDLVIKHRWYRRIWPISYIINEGCSVRGCRNPSKYKVSLPEITDIEYICQLEETTLKE